jgi:hypothetical protein
VASTWLTAIWLAGQIENIGKYWKKIEKNGKYWKKLEKIIKKRKNIENY